ncbi:hypothetical protein ADIAL_0467 [Alkalibacterium sp. AK22]|uniref:ASCH domain-containing protein n=1 Tax=Alkalibacterium sp. AK22 TaxID=1229520 RepID=UPI000446664B|nr:ASCH domain-containing protein [Alkalibacterium sp. AK22]EXJ24087.1 hypothetical protein ADIAL_0467 [Alkalibacterium sp. AK22]
MMHKMGLHKEYVQAIKGGSKQIEIRLCDSKRKQIRRGDRIRFQSTASDKEQLDVTVTSLQVFKDFKSLYEAIPFKKMGCEGWSMEDMLEETYAIYSSEQEQLYGVLAIGIRYEGQDDRLEKIE